MKKAIKYTKTKTKHIREAENKDWFRWPSVPDECKEMQRLMRCIDNGETQYVDTLMDYLISCNPRGDYSDYYRLGIEQDNFKAKYLAAVNSNKIYHPMSIKKYLICREAEKLADAGDDRFKQGRWGREAVVGEYCGLAFAAFVLAMIVGVLTYFFPVILEYVSLWQIALICAGILLLLCFWPIEK